jgi:hypothetical protein
MIVARQCAARFDRASPRSRPNDFGTSDSDGTPKDSRQRLPNGDRREIATLVGLGQGAGRQHMLEQVVWLVAASCRLLAMVRKRIWRQSRARSVATLTTPNL